jgi:hypothetical protein
MKMNEKERKGLLVSGISLVLTAIIGLFLLVAMSGCVIYAYCPEGSNYPTETGVNYIDAPYVPGYGVGVYYGLGQKYPYYHYYGGYGYRYGGKYYYRYHRVWYHDSFPYYYNDNGYVVQIYDTDYYYYDVTVNNWFSAPLPSDASAYGYSSNGYPVPPATLNGNQSGPKHHVAYPPDSSAKPALPKVKAIPKSPNSSAGYDHYGYPPNKVGNSPSVPKPSGTKPVIKELTPGALTKKPVAPQYYKPSGTKPKITGISPKVVPKKPVTPQYHKPKSVPTGISSVSPKVAPKKPVAPKYYKPKPAPNGIPNASPKVMPKKPVASKYHSPAIKPKVSKPAYIPKTPAYKVKPKMNVAPKKPSVAPKYFNKPVYKKSYPKSSPKYHQIPKK